jgi:hypothetical protein
MRGATQMMGRALVGALVLAWMATVAWSQSLTWLGTLGGDWSGLMVFPPTAPWWSAGLTTPQGISVPFAGRIVFHPWWSAGLATPQGSGVPFAGRMQDLGTLGGLESGLWCFRRWRRGGRLG